MPTIIKPAVAAELGFGWFSIIYRCDRWQFDTEALLSELRAEVECEPPNNSLYTFTGNLQLSGTTFGLTTNQARSFALERMCSLRAASQPAPWALMLACPLYAWFP